MTDARGIAGTYADLKFIKTRSVAQIVVEVPIEQVDAFLEMFGAPQPGKEIPVAIARLNGPVAQMGERATTGKPPGSSASEVGGSNPSGAKPRRAFKGLSLPEQAGVRANDPAFWTFLHERHQYKPEALQWDAAFAAVAIRDICGVASRKELPTNHDAANIWRELELEYQAWLTDQQYADTAR